jgi:hypothetical protein
MSHGLDIEWDSATTARIVNRSGYRLRHVRAIATGGARIAGRPQWVHDVENFQPGDSIRLVRIEANSYHPAIKIRFQVAYTGDMSPLSPWRTDELPLFIPVPEDQDPWGLGSPPPAQPSTVPEDGSR